LFAVCFSRGKTYFDRDCLTLEQNQNSKLVRDTTRGDLKANLEKCSGGKKQAMVCEKDADQTTPHFENPSLVAKERSAVVEKGDGVPGNWSSCPEPIEKRNWGLKGGSMGT